MAQTSNEIKDVIMGWIQGRVDDARTALPATIEAFAPGTNRANVRPWGDYKADDGRKLPFPLIYNVPVCFPVGNGGLSGVTFPVKSGDSCLLIFSDQQMTNWLSGGKADSDDPRRHDLNDAIAIPGLYSAAATANATFPDDVVIRNGSAVLRLTQNSFSGTVGGTTFSFSDGDLIVNGISLVHHRHGGVDTGSGTTQEPQ